MAKGSALTAKKTLSDEGAAFMGKPKASRAELMKEIWSYIRENELKDENGTVCCDQVLYDLLGVRSFTGVHKVPTCLKDQEVFLD